MFNNQKNNKPSRRRYFVDRVNKIRKCLLNLMKALQIQKGRKFKRPESSKSSQKSKIKKDISLYITKLLVRIPIVC